MSESKLSQGSPQKFKFNSDAQTQLQAALRQELGNATLPQADATALQQMKKQRELL